MTTLLERHPADSSYEASEHDRQQLIADMDKVHGSSPNRLSLAIRSRLLARRAVNLALREETYPLQAVDIANRLVAMNPNLQDTAHTIVEKKFAKKEDIPKPLAELTHMVVDKTVEKSEEQLASSEEDTDTIPRLVISAMTEVDEEHMSHMLPISEEAKQQAIQHEKAFEEEQKRERVEASTDLDVPTGGFSQDGVQRRLSLEELEAADDAVKAA